MSAPVEPPDLVARLKLHAFRLAVVTMHSAEIEALGRELVRLRTLPELIRPNIGPASELTPCDSPGR